MTPRPLALRVTALTTAILVHAALLSALFSGLQVGTFALRTPPNALLERASPVPAVKAVIFLVPSHFASELASDQSSRPRWVSPDLKPIPMASSLPQTGWDIAGESSAPTSATSHPGTLGVRCEVHIHEDAQGHVQAIDFGTCTQSAAWQRVLLASIVQAASTATPSPATHPPELTLTLDTNRISPVILAHLLSESSTSTLSKAPANIVTWPSE